MSRAPLQHTVELELSVARSCNSEIADLDSYRILMANLITFDTFERKLPADIDLILQRIPYFQKLLEDVNERHPLPRSLKLIETLHQEVLNIPREFFEIPDNQL